MIDLLYGLIRQAITFSVVRLFSKTASILIQQRLKLFQFSTAKPVNTHKYLRQSKEVISVFSAEVENTLNRPVSVITM